jgi:hypothetical protein
MDKNDLITVYAMAYIAVAISTVLGLIWLAFTLIGIQ